jgi:hypothetical protein
MEARRRHRSGTVRCAVTDDDWRGPLLRTLKEMVQALDAPHADVRARIRGVVDELESSPPGVAPDRLLRRVRRLRQGTMGSLSDVVFADLRDGRWIADPTRTDRWTRLSQRLAEDVSRLPPAKAPDLYLVTDRVRECWLDGSASLARPPWPVEVFPPVWLDRDATTDEINLGPAVAGPIPEDGLEVSVLWDGGGVGGRRVLGSGRVFTSRASAKAAARRL